MPRPIEEKDKQRLRNYYRDHGWRARFKSHHKLGIYAWLDGIDTDPDDYWSYSLDSQGNFIFVKKRTIDRRKLSGRPGKRKSPKLMKDISLFSMEEMELAEKVMKELK